MYPTLEGLTVSIPHPPPQKRLLVFTFFKKFEVLPQEMWDISQLFPTSHYFSHL